MVWQGNGTGTACYVWISLYSLYIRLSTTAISVTIPGTHVSWCCPALPVMELQPLQYPHWIIPFNFNHLMRHYDGLCVFTWKQFKCSCYTRNIQGVKRNSCHLNPSPKAWLDFHLWQQDTLEMKLLSFWPYLPSPCIQKGSFVSVYHSADSTQILPLYVLYNRLRMV